MTSPAYPNTAEQVIVQAYRNAGLVGEAQLPNSGQYASGMLRLNALVAWMQTQGLKLWTLVDTPLTLVLNQGPYVVGPAGAGISMTKPFRVIQAYFLSSSGAKTPMTPASWQEIVQLQTAQQYGQPVNYFVDKQATLLNITLWPAPDSTAVTGTVHLVFQTQMTQMTGLTDSTMFPLEWFLALSWGLADEISSGQPKDIQDKCASRAKEFRTSLENWDVEDAQTFFSPDLRSGYSYSSFV